MQPDAPSRHVGEIKSQHGRPTVQVAANEPEIRSISSAAHRTPSRHRVANTLTLRKTQQWRDTDNTRSAKDAELQLPDS
jgi:hypothetical protein